MRRSCQETSLHTRVAKRREGKREPTRDLGDKKNPEAPLPPTHASFSEEPRRTNNRTVRLRDCPREPREGITAGIRKEQGQGVDRRELEKPERNRGRGGETVGEGSAGGGPASRPGRPLAPAQGWVIAVVRVRAVTVATTHASEHRANQNTIPVTRNKGKKWRSC